MKLCDAFGFNFILIETVGAGQGDTAVRSFADAVVLLLQPETGDELQWEKAGVLEVADAVVIHKADLPGTERAVAQVKAAMDMTTGRQVPVLPVSSRTGAGLDELVALVESVSKRSRTDADAKKELLRLAQQELATRFAKSDVGAIVKDWKEGKEALRTILDQLFRKLNEIDKH